PPGRARRAPGRSRDRSEQYIDRPQRRSSCGKGVVREIRVVGNGREKWKAGTLGHTFRIVAAGTYNDQTDRARHAPEERRGTEQRLKLRRARPRHETKAIER